MNGHRFAFCGASLIALPSGALFWPAKEVLCVSDLHLGKSERIARRDGRMLPPYDARATLERLAEDVAATAPARVICLGDSFDDPTAAREMPADIANLLSVPMTGRKWVWIEGNHDPGPPAIGGMHRAEMTIGRLTFRHAAAPGASGEVSGHYHPKARVAARGRVLNRRCFLVDEARLILPAYGAYTGGLPCDHPDLAGLMRASARAILLPGRGKTPLPIPMPR